jgi:hypothetical protein
MIVGINKKRETQRKSKIQEATTQPSTAASRYSFTPIPTSLSGTPTLGTLYILYTSLGHSAPPPLESLGHERQTLGLSGGLYMLPFKGTLD